MTAVRGTPQERREARRRRTHANRAKTFTDRIRSATTGREVLVHACNYALAVARGLDDAGRRDLARQIVAVVDERNTPR